MADTIDLQFNYPSVAEEGAILRNYFSGLTAEEAETLLAFPPFQGNAQIIQAAATPLGLLPGFFQETTRIVMCNSGNQALSAVLQVLRPHHTTLLCEPFTYPGFKMIARSLDYQLKACTFDEHGLTVAGLEEAIALTGSRIVYLQPTLQNPTCVVMPLERRQQLAAFAREKKLILIEDDAYRFLCKNPPPRLLDLIPDRTFHIYSLSKPFNPLIKTAFLMAPASYAAALTHAVRMSSSGNSSLLAGLANHVLQTGLLQEVVRQKQELAKTLQQTAREILGDWAYQTHPTSFHLWLRLPQPRKAGELAARLLTLGVQVPVEADFAVEETADETFIRLSLGAEKDLLKLKKALLTVAAVLQGQQ